MRKPWVHLSTQDLLPSVPLNAANPFFPGEGMRAAFARLDCSVVSQAALSGFTGLRLSGSVLPHSME
jgi:hypothetical protein